MPPATAGGPFGSLHRDSAMAPLGHIMAHLDFHIEPYKAASHQELGGGALVKIS